MHSVTHSAPPPPVVPVVKLAWPLVALIAVLAAVFVGLYALAPDGAKPDLTPLFGLFSGIPAALAALAAYVQSRRNAVQVEQHGQTIQKIDAQTNGQLDQRIVSAVGQAIDQRPTLFTDAAVAQGISKLLEQHLEAASSTTPGDPVTVSTVTQISPAVPFDPPPAAAPSTPQTAPQD